MEPDMHPQQPLSPVSSEGPLAASIELNRHSDVAADEPATFVETAIRCAEDWKRFVYLALAGVFFVVGVLGALLPVLPATPFLLLASCFLSKSSPRLNRALLRSRLFGPILRDWQQLGGIRRSVRVKAVVAVTLAVVVTLVVSELSVDAMLAVVVLAQVGIVVVLRLPSANESNVEPQVD
jgi:uncharacterized membrane protein YbaN (DUF454 family)